MSMTIVYVLLYAMAGIMVLASVLPLLKVPHGAIKGLEFPRIQLFWVALALAGVAAWIEGALYVGLIFAAVALLQVFYIAKFTPIWWRQTLDAGDALRKDTRRHIHFVAANVKKSNRDYDKLIELTQREKPDVVMAIEVDDDWIKGLEDGLRDLYPHWIKVPKDTGYGLCVLSRLEVRDTEVREMLTEGVPSIRLTLRLRSGDDIRLYVVHPEPPTVTHDTKGRDAEIALIGMEAADDDLPAIVTGDLNDVAWSSTTRRFQRLSGLVDPRVGRGFYNTFSAFHWWARWPLDHLFHDARFRQLGMVRLEKIGSDHFPMMFELALAESKSEIVDLEDADLQEEAEVKKVIHEERARDRSAIGTDWEDED